MEHKTGSGRGNWTRTYSYATDASNHLLETKIGGNSYNHNHYDHHGNMTKMPHLQALSWNFRDKLVAVALNKTGDMAYYNYEKEWDRSRKVITPSWSQYAKLNKWG